MDTYNDTKNAEYKTPQNKTSKVAFLFFLRELKEMIKSSSMIIINSTQTTPALHHTIHHQRSSSSRSIIPRPKKIS
jgi:hypothetical protein